jgi:hypothetical protein
MYLAFKYAILSPMSDFYDPIATEAKWQKKMGAGKRIRF